MSVITFGTSFVGKVDRVPGHGYVATKAFQIVNVPLIPLASFLVREGTETQSFVSGLQSFDGVPTSLSMKSFGWGVVRAVWFAASLLTAMGALPMAMGLEGAGLGVAWVTGIVALVAWFRTRRGLLASDERKSEIIRLLGAAGAQARMQADLPSARVVAE